MAAALVVALAATACGGAAAKPEADLRPRGPSCEAAYKAYFEASLANAAFAKKGRYPPELPAEAYGNILDYGNYFRHCEVEDEVEIAICAAVQDGRALGVTVQTSPRRPRAEACIDDAVRGLRFPRHPKMEMTRTFFGAPGSPAWGTPRDDSAAQARVLEFLKSLSAEGDHALLLCAPTLVAMPELWARLVQADSTLSVRGIETSYETKFDGPRREFSMRVLDSPPDIQAVLKSKGLREIAGQLVNGKIRPAGASEREAVYKQQIVAFMPNTPITVVEAGQLKLAFLLSEGKVYWMELIAQPPAQPAPPPAAPTSTDAAPPPPAPPSSAPTTP